MIAHEDNLTAGFGAEIAATVAHETFWQLDAPVDRIAVEDIPMPYPILLDAVLPSVDRIAERIAASWPSPVHSVQRTAPQTHAAARGLILAGGFDHSVRRHNAWPDRLPYPVGIGPIRCSGIRKKLQSRPATS